MGQGLIGDAKKRFSEQLVTNCTTERSANLSIQFGARHGISSGNGFLCKAMTTASFSLLLTSWDNITRKARSYIPKVKLHLTSEILLSKSLSFSDLELPDHAEAETQQI